jgi:hypothetical protein
MVSVSETIAVCANPITAENRLTKSIKDFIGRLV